MMFWAVLQCTPSISYKTHDNHNIVSLYFKDFSDLFTFLFSSFLTDLQCLDQHSLIDTKDEAFIQKINHFFQSNTYYESSFCIHFTSVTADQLKNSTLIIWLTPKNSFSKSAEIGDSTVFLLLRVLKMPKNWLDILQSLFKFQQKLELDGHTHISLLDMHAQS